MLIPVIPTGIFYMLSNRLNKASVSDPLSFKFGSVNQVNGSKDPDPHQTVTDPEHCLQVCIFVHIFELYL